MSDSEPKIVSIKEAEIEEAKIISTIMMSLAYNLQNIEQKLTDNNDEDLLNQFRKIALPTMHGITAVLAGYDIHAYLDDAPDDINKIRGYALYTFLRTVNEKLYNGIKIPGMSSTPKEILTKYATKNLGKKIDTDSNKSRDKIISDIEDTLNELKKTYGSEPDTEISEKKTKKKKKKEKEKE